jgi:hypothetical protein
MEQMDTSTAIASISLVLSVLSHIFHYLNHTRVRSNCCGRKLEASLDISRIENVSP